MRGLIVCFLVTTTSAALAQTPAPSREALVLANRVAHSAQPRLEASLQAMVQQLADGYKQTAASQSEPVDDKALAEVNKSEQEAVKPLLWDGMARIYARVYTLDELKALNAFYHDHPGVAPQSLPISLAAKNDDIEQGEMELSGQLGPRILQDFFGDYCSRAPCSNGIRRTAGLPVKEAAAPAP